MDVYQIVVLLLGACLAQILQIRSIDCCRNRDTAGSAAAVIWTLTSAFAWVWFGIALSGFG